MVFNIEQTGKMNHYTLMAILKPLGKTETDLELFDGKNISGGSPKNSEILILKVKLENAYKEIKTLKELVKSQKKLIAVLERKK